jgi:hypothetical protein
MDKEVYAKRGIEGLEALKQQLAYVYRKKSADRSKVEHQRMTKQHADRHQKRVRADCQELMDLLEEYYHKFAQLCEEEDGSTNQGNRTRSGTS